MKRIIKILIVTIAGLFLTTGCFLEENNFEDNLTITTIYPIEFIANELYSDYSTVRSIYPNGAKVDNYKLTEKLKSNYSKSNMLIYNGLSNEKKYAVDFLNKNKNIQIIDAMQGMNYIGSEQELWLDPSNYLMLATNVKNGLRQYNSNVYTKDKIKEKYDDFKVKVSELDVELNLISKKANKTIIITSDNTLKFLEKYNITVISLDPKNEESNASYAKARRLANSGNVSYIYLRKNEQITTQVQDFIASTKLKKHAIDTMETITDDQRKNNENYITIMTSNIEKIKDELYG